MMARPSSGERGTALVEFAMVSAALVLLMFSIIDFSRAVYTQHLVDFGARLGTRHAIVNGVASCAGGTPDPSQSYVRGLSPGINATLLTVTTTCPGGNTGCSRTSSPFDGAGCLVTVKVSYTYQFLVPTPVTSIPMSSTSQMVISQ
jgi:Flp pilus assembly protein TadG